MTYISESGSLRIVKTINNYLYPEFENNKWKKTLL